MKIALIAAACLLGIASSARAETYDVATFEPPGKWTRQDGPVTRAYMLVDQKAGTFCRLALYASVPTKGNARSDFDADWRDVIVSQITSAGAAQIQEPAVVDGWTMTTGGTVAKWEGRDMATMLMVASNATHRFTISYLATGDCLADVTPVFSSLKLRAGDMTPSLAAPSTATKTGEWTTSAQSELVELRREKVVVRLYFATPIPDHLRADSDGKRDHFWATYVAPRYQQITNVVKPRIEGYATTEMVEADAVDKATRERVHVAFHMFTSNGVVSGVEVSAPSKAALDAAYPDTTKIDALRALNRFPVSTKDLVGTWNDSSGAFLEYYNVYSGDSAGVYASSSSYKLTLRAKGTFSSVVKAVNGRLGAAKFAQENRSGTWKLTDGSTLTMKVGGAQKTYSVWFEAVRGGRVLHMLDQQKSGMHDVLTLEK